MNYWKILLEITLGTMIGRKFVWLSFQLSFLLLYLVSVLCNVTFLVLNWSSSEFFFLPYFWTAITKAVTSNIVERNLMKFGE